MDWYERTTFWSSAHARNLTPRSLPETRTRSPRFCRRPQFSARSLYYAIQASTFKMDATNNLLSLKTTSLEISHHLSACMYDVAWHIFRASHIGIRYLLWTFGDSLLQINSQKISLKSWHDQKWSPDFWKDSAYVEIDRKRSRAVNGLRDMCATGPTNSMLQW